MTKTKELVRLSDNVTPSWGHASDRRGVSNTQLAIDFVSHFPVGTTLNAAEFDAWCDEHGLLKIPPADMAKDSDAWKAHIQRRHEVRHKLRNSGTHPRLKEYGATPFTIDTIRQGTFEVRAPHAAVTRSRVAQQLEHLIGTKRKQLAYLMQSADWEALPPHERPFAESIYDDIDMFERQITLWASGLSERLAKLTHRLNRAIEAGRIVPQNHALAQFVSPEAEEERAETE